MDSKFKPYRTGMSTDKVKHHHRSCGCLGRKQTKPIIESDLPMIDKVIEHRNHIEKWLFKIVYKNQILVFGTISFKFDAEVASKDVEIVIEKIEN